MPYCKKYFEKGCVWVSCTHRFKGGVRT